MLEKLAHPNTEILNNPEGSVEAWPGIPGAAPDEGGSTDWELLQSEQILQYWNSIVQPQGPEPLR